MTTGEPGSTPHATCRNGGPRQESDKSRYHDDKHEMSPEPTVFYTKAPLTSFVTPRTKEFPKLLGDGRPYVLAVNEIVPAGIGRLPEDKSRPGRSAARFTMSGPRADDTTSETAVPVSGGFPGTGRALRIIGERTCQCVVTGDDLRDVGKIDRVARFLGVVADREYVTPVRLRGYDRKPRTCKTLRTSRGWQVLRPLYPCGGRTTTKAPHRGVDT